MATSKIEWTDKTWNPVRGCSRVSPGCEHCYAELMAARFSDEGYWGHGFAERTEAGGRWTRKVSLIREKLADPLGWRKPCKIFVNSTSDLFHEKLTFEEIAAVVGVMPACPQHTFQTLTKRAARMLEWLEWSQEAHGPLYAAGPSVVIDCAFLKMGCDIKAMGEEHPGRWTGAMKKLRRASAPWPLPNWHVGVSAEDQKRWDERKESLQLCPAAVRFVSAEPLLGPIDLGDLAGIHQIIVGGESGPGARPCRLEWIDSIVDQCRSAGVAVFVKQLGAWPANSLTGVGPDPYRNRCAMGIYDKKGGDPFEWPGGLDRFPREEP